MESGTVLFLLSYPLSILANFSTDFLAKNLKKTEIAPLKNLFIEAFVFSLKENAKGLDSIGKEAIRLVEGEVSRDKNKVFRIISESISDNTFLLNDLDREQIGEEISDKLMIEFNLSEISLARNVIKDCLRNYEENFFLLLTEKQGNHFLFRCLTKLNSDVAKKSDIDELKLFLVEHIASNKEVEGHEENLRSFIHYELANPESSNFSNSIVDFVNPIKKKIDNLTAEQYQVIHHIRYRKRAIISGCAGSGKTLIAAEKAIRLDNAGIKTLILCHNPHLADYIKKLVTDSSVDVSDITSFINKLSGTHIQDEWCKYSEPLEKNVDKAFDNIIESGISYDAVIVDEGQDFRGSWWTIIEAILEESRSNILYIFYDDNQSLLPFRAKYPIEELPVSMSKNCRNAGKIFEIVKKFHPNSPLTSRDLSSDGLAKLTIANDLNYKDKITDAIQDAACFVDYQQIKIVTCENDIYSSLICGTEFPINASMDWRKYVLNDLRKARDKLLKGIENLRSHSSMSEIGNRYNFDPEVDLDRYFKLPDLTKNIKPTKGDIQSVSNFAQKLMPGNKSFKENNTKLTSKLRKAATKRHGISNTENVKFIVKNKALQLVEYKPPNYNKVSNANKSSRLNFYCFNSWADSLPTNLLTKIVTPYSDSFLSDEKTVPLYSINMFKGLEAEAVILFVNTVCTELDMELYVGASRAIGYLNIVINRSVLSKVRQLEET
ncbi:MAG: DUF2075 domain-containing protein [Colwellia sp.]|nr:DUF2075 domain-containing protein [Colwellia sp.]